MELNTFIATDWNEQPISGSGEQPRFSYAHTKNRYKGTIEGESVCDYLLYYNGAGYNGVCTGIERIECRVDGREGSFVIQHDGRFDDHGIAGTWRILTGSGTDELRKISGSGTLKTTMDSKSVPYTFDYRLP